MLDRRPSQQDAFRIALGPGNDCPPIEELERYASSAALSASELGEHVKSCSYCQTELHLLKTFQSEEAGPMSEGARRTAELLRKRSKEILRQPASDKVQVPWWKAAFAMRGLAQASLAAAMILAVAGITIQFRTTTQPPALNQSSGSGQDVVRSGSFAVVSPMGDLHESPSEIRWEKVPNAASYRVHLLEVDRNELWKAETKEDHIDLPASVRSRVVPAKTLFCEITAFDSSGNKVGETGPVRFRLVQTKDGH